MLILGSRLLDTPIMSLQTGGRLATTTKPIIDPGTLKVIAYEVDGSLLAQKPSFVRTADIREYGRLGMILDSNDELIGLDDVLEVEKLYAIGFPLIGMSVIDDTRRRIGKVSDYTIETNGYVIQQLSINRGFFKSFNDTGALIHRSQIVEINDQAIVVKSAKIANVEPIMASLRGEFINPFRKPAQTAQPEQDTTN